MSISKLFLGSVFLFLILFSSSACQKKSKKHSQQKKELTEIQYDTSQQKGTVLPEIISRADSTIRFALYLPKNYSISKNWPVVFFFDAQARGKLPLELYKDLADKYGYILIGSNNSKNRTDWSVNKEEIQKLINDAFGRFAIDQQRVYTSGFSGGARVACLVAIDLAKIQGVVGCAAGFPELNKPIETPFCYLGFSGDVDFNRVEMERLDESLASSGLPYYISYYKGKHDWAASEFMNDGFLWLEFNAYKNNLSPKNESLISEFKKQIVTESSLAKKGGNTWAFYLSLKKGLTFLNGLTDVSEYNNQIAELEKSDKLQKAKAAQKKLMEQEVSKQDEYTANLSSKGIEWWKQEIATLNKKAANSNNPDEGTLAKRLLNFVSLMSNMSVNNNLTSKQPEATLFFLTIYGMADPKNPDYFYLSAIFFAEQSNVEKALSSLRNAVKYGYKDKKNLLNNAAFDMIRKNKSFDEIVQSIKN